MISSQDQKVDDLVEKIIDIEREAMNKKLGVGYSKSINPDKIDSHVVNSIINLLIEEESK